MIIHVVEGDTIHHGTESKHFQDYILSSTVLDGSSLLTQLHECGGGKERPPWKVSGGVVWGSTLPPAQSERAGDSPHHSRAVQAASC